MVVVVASPPGDSRSTKEDLPCHHALMLTRRSIGCTVISVINHDHLNIAGKSLRRSRIICLLFKLHRMSAVGKISIGCAIYKLVEAFLEKAEGFDDLETKFVIPLVEDALDGFMKTASEIIPSEFLSLSKMVINKCNEANKIVSTLFNSSDEEIFYVEHSDYCLALLEEACLHRSKVFTKFTDPELNCIIQFTRWAMMKQTELNITKTSASCLLEMLKAFEERGDQSAFYKEHMLGFVDDAVILLCRSPGSDIKTICFDILAHLFTVVDNVSEPLWDSNYFPTHYNGMFAREQAANIIQSRLHTPYSEATKFVDGLFEARGDFSGFREKANNLLSQLKRPHQISESVPASTSYEYPLSSSCPELLAATLEKNYGERFENFLKKYKQDGCHSPHYEGVVCAMYMTGQIKFIVDFEHIISHDVSLASDMLVAFSRFQHKMKVVVSKYVSDMKRKLDDAFSGSMPHLSSQSLCGEVAVFVVHMPESIESFSEFIKLPGNEVVMDQTIFQGPNSVVIQKKTDIGRLALCSYIQEICQKHADGDSWDGQLSLEDFKVFNKKVFKICRRSCGFCTHLSTSRDYEKFAMDFLKLYGNSAFIKVLINDMKTFIRVEEYNDAAAREFRFRMMTHFAGKSSVLRALIFVEFFRGIRLLKHQARCSVALALSRQLVAWLRKAKDNPVLLKVYNHGKDKTVILENLERLEKSLPAGSDEELDAVVDRLRRLVMIDSKVLLESDSQPDAAIDDEKPSEVVVFYDERKSVSQPGDEFYNATLLSLVFYVRHGVTHIGDLDNAGKSTWIRKLIELELLLSHVLGEEMSHLTADLVLNINMLSDEALEMLEDSWNIFASLITNIPYSEPLGLRELRALKSRKN